jgi:hypothetical protein
MQEDVDAAPAICQRGRQDLEEVFVSLHGVTTQTDRKGGEEQRSRGRAPEG